jgi:hypothetical protein
LLPSASSEETASSSAMIITFRGVALAALIPLDNINYETVSLSTNPEFIEILEQSRKRVSEEGGISSEEMRQFFEAAE